MALPDDKLICRLLALDSCAVSDALDREKIRGVALGLAPLSTLRRIAGRAITVQLATDDGRERTRHLCTAAVEVAGPESIIVVAHRGRLDVAGWGGILSTAASVRGVAGVIVDGAVRDLDETRG